MGGITFFNPSRWKHQTRKWAAISSPHLKIFKIHSKQCIAPFPLQSWRIKSDFQEASQRNIKVPRCSWTVISYCLDFWYRVPLRLPASWSLLYEMKTKRGWKEGLLNLWEAATWKMKSFSSLQMKINQLSQPWKDNESKKLYFFLKKEHESRTALGLTS